MRKGEREGEREDEREGEREGKYKNKNDGNKNNNSQCESLAPSTVKYGQSVPICSPNRVGVPLVAPIHDQVAFLSAKRKEKCTKIYEGKQQ